MKIRRVHQNAFAELQRRERRARLAAEIVADDEKARIDREGNIVLEDSRGNQSVLELTDQGIAGLRTDEGRHYHLDRDQTGRIVRVTDPINQTVEIDYTPEGPIGEIRRNGKRMLGCEYGNDGDTLVATFADGARERLEYQAGQLVRTVDANGAENRFVRNQGLQVVEVVDPNGHSTRFDYDEDGIPLRRLLPNGSEETYEEDDDGSFIVKVNGRPQIKITADESGDNERADFADGHFITLQWDGDKPLEGVNGHSRVAFEYNGKGNPVREIQGDLAIEYEYDGEENLVAIRTSDSEELRFHYDGDDLLVGITDWSGRELTLTSDKAGSTTGIQFPNGVTTGATTSPEGHYTSIETISPAYVNGPVVSERYVYDARDRLVNRVVPGNEWRYTYDPAGQLIACEDASGAIEAFAYDAAGNLILSRLGDAQYDACNRILSVGGERFEHDEHGNLVQCQGSCNEFYRYNGQGHLLEVSDTRGQTVTFAYDAFGRRIRKQCGNTTTHFLWAGRQLLREWTECDGEVVERRDYVFIPGEGYPIAVRINGEPYYYHTDRLGTPMALTDPSGTVVWKAEYSPFGEARILVEKVRQPLRFLGQYCDAETGLHYNVFRYYDPTLGRYLTPDPLRYGSGSTNLYQYAHNDPINRRDPDGLIAPLVVLGIIAGAALIGGLIGGAVEAATAPPGERASAFAKGFGWGALAGAVGAAVPIIGAAAGLGAAAIAGIALAADAVVAGVEACADGGWDAGTFAKGAGISVAMTIGTLGLAKIPGVKRALGAVGKRLSGAVDDLSQGAKKLWGKVKPKKTQPKKTGGGDYEHWGGEFLDDGVSRREAAEKAAKAAKEAKSAAGDKAATHELNEIKAKKAKESAADHDKAAKEAAARGDKAAAKKHKESARADRASAKGYEAENKIAEELGDDVVKAGQKVDYTTPDGKAVKSDIDLETKSEVIQVKSGGDMPSKNQMQATIIHAQKTGKKPVVIYNEAEVTKASLEHMKRIYPDVDFHGRTF